MKLKLQQIIQEELHILLNEENGVPTDEEIDDPNRDYYYRRMQRYEDEVKRSRDRERLEQTARRMRGQSSDPAEEARNMHYPGHGTIAAAQNRYKAGDPPWLYPGEERFRRGIFEKDVVDTGNIQIDMGEVAYADWQEAYDDPFHPEHEIAVSALPAVSPENSMYPEKWRQITQGGEIIESQLHQVIQEELEILINNNKKE